MFRLRKKNFNLKGRFMERESTLSKYLSERAVNVKGSPTLLLDAKAKRLKAEGRDIIFFTAGEPDFDTPINIKEAGIKAIREGFTKYCPVDGTPSLKKAVSDRFERDFGLKYSPEEILVSPGAKMGIFEALFSLLNKGDETIVISPYWVSYPDMVKLASGVPKIVNTTEEMNFVPKPEDIEKNITSKTKVLILNYPSNPTGAVYPRKVLNDIADIVISKDIFVISDEIYANIVFEEEFVSFPSIRKELKNRTILISGVSKTYSMTGWRIGVALGPKEIITPMKNIQSQTTSNPTSISLKAAEEAFSGSQSSVLEMVSTFRRRRDLIYNLLSKIRGVTCFKPKGAFYIFPNVSRYGKSRDICEYLLDKDVAAVPGVDFGSEGYIRLSFATSDENIIEGIKRIEKALTELDNLKK